LGRLFGTDGVRGLANKDLTPELAFELGKAGAYVLTKAFKHAPKIIIGDDTRLSGDMLKSALAAGMCSVGAHVYYAGSIPTPAIAFLTKKLGFDAGAMISASHNPYHDNGIKFFNRDGFKLSDALEDEIEAVIASGFKDVSRALNGDIGTIAQCENAIDTYLEFLHGTMDGIKLDGLKIALDCANGATSEAAPLFFDGLGARVFVSANEPDGYNINDGCGSGHIENLRAFTVECGADIGLAFDGDGDRLIAVDENGSVVDGDMVMSMLSVRMNEEGKLKNNTLVATVMSNLGMINGCKSRGVSTVATKVGDRYVLEKMLEEGYNLGGESSGHIIMTDYATSGDGILTAAQLIKHMKLSGRNLSELNTIMKPVPLILENARVPNEKKAYCMAHDAVKAKYAELEKKYAGNGRILLRPSGTEPLVRVMIEGEDLADVAADAKALAELIESLC
jgi:phosphoglucosamine mutase